MMNVSPCKVSLSLELFHAVHSASSLDLHFRGFHSPVTAAELHFQTHVIFAKNRIPRNFKIGFSKTVNPRVCSDKISEIRPSGR